MSYRSHQKHAMRKLLFTLLLLLASCAPPQESIQQATTQTPSPVPTETPDLPDLEADYITQYTTKLDEWLQDFQRWDDANDRISAEGITALDDQEFKNELTSLLAHLEQVSKELAELTPPTDKLNLYQEKAEELHAHTQKLNSMYLPALSGSNAAADAVFAALDHVSATYLEINALLRERQVPDTFQT
jgi:DNA repair exonuclease SbcCD ATPase subunit